ncbi:hypothetical protein GOODEAATRI_033429, partial [Goodea atripinnis]
YESATREQEVSVFICAEKKVRAAGEEDGARRESCREAESDNRGQDVVTEQPAAPSLC